MPRSVNAVASRKRRKKILKATRGYFGARNNVYTAAKNTLEKAMMYSYTDRRKKKRNFRRLWIARINGTTYSRLIDKLSKANITLNRKTLADLALNHPDAFKAVVQAVG